MGFWNKLGKLALTAAPYVAAPFTGGASLLGTGLANKGVQKWSQKDAEKNMSRGLAPSKFDSVLGKVGGISSLASSFIPGGQLGALGKLGGIGGKLANVASKGGVVGNLAKVGQGALGGGGFGMNNGGMTPPYFPQGQGGGQGMDWSQMIGQGMNALRGRGQQDYAGGTDYQTSWNPQQQGPMGPSNQAYGQMSNRTPNLEDYFRQGSQEGLYDSGRQPYPESIYGGLGGYRRFGNQPYRGGYGGGGQRRGGGGRAIPRQGPLQDFMRQNEQRMRQPYIMN